MTDRKISELGSIPNISPNTDIVPIVDIDANETKSATVSNLVESVIPDALLASNNLSDLSDAASARTNLGLGTAATTASTDYAAASHTHTLSEITDAGTAAAAATTDFAAASHTHTLSEITDAGTAAAAATTDFVAATGDTMTGDLDFGDSVKATFGASSDLQIYHDGSNSYIDDVGTGDLVIRANNLRMQNATGTAQYILADDGGAVQVRYNGGTKLATTSTGVDVTGTVTATAFSGDGSSLTGITAGAGATGGGTDKIFWENDQNVTTDYTITNGQNAMSAGPITINSGITVTVGTGETWTVV